MEFKRILVAYDGSQDANKAVEAACAIAGGKASLVVLHVYGISVMAYVGPAGIPQSNVNALEQGAKDAAHDVAMRGVSVAEKLGVNATAEVVESVSIVETIVNFAAANKIDLIVVGTRGNTGFKKLLMGSVSSGVLSHAGCPVMVVR